MKWIAGGRGYGKTTEVVRWLLEDTANRVVVAANEHEAQRLRKEYPLLPERCFVSLSSYHHRTGDIGKAVAIDNVDLVLSSLLGGFVDLATFTDHEPGRPGVPNRGHLMVLARPLHPLNDKA